MGSVWGVIGDFWRIFPAKFCTVQKSVQVLKKKIFKKTQNKFVLLTSCALSL